MASILSSYRKAALGALTSKLSSNGDLRVLSSSPEEVSHPGASAEQLEAYRRLFGGEAFDGVHRSSLPSVLVHILGFPLQLQLMTREDFPLQLMGLVHLSNQVEHRRPIAPGQPLRLRAHAENLRPHRKGTQVDIVTEAFSAAAAEEAPLWRGASTYLSRGVFLAGKPDRSEESRSGGAGFVPPPMTAQWSLGSDEGRRYAAVSGDYNPIHLSGLSAKALGMPKAIVHGMYTAARILEGREPDAAGHSWSISFDAPVTLPGKVAVSVEKPDEKTQLFTGWNPRKGRRHFSGELHLP
ncbi:MaoC/PaaZ C-terminal domain-containing protein [Nesterenkonia lacusekhoensis]|uniref:Acyl dehydratase n=1 Tax=Nesterenkonia lacusekhoensis TaxID=150832 RepID=A0ABS4T1A8_9MICC|nr:MaoC/PaaZ C-terminal domain-containing protein [Nesterenkonia lacusekhoensis]MBP2318241.1 acyl dehydratase [Nesterenkonia lacusekhoensis]